MKKKQPYERAGVKPAEVLMAFDVLMVLGLHDASVELLERAATNEAKLLELIRLGAEEANRRNIGSCRRELSKSDYWSQTAEGHA